MSKALFYARFLSIFYICFLLTACSTSNFKAQYYSTVLPTYDFDTNAPTMIVASPWDLSSKYYAGIALLALKERGFNNIYLQGQIDESFIRNVIYVKVTKDKIDPANNYQYTFNATGICNVINGVPSCSIDTKNGESSQKVTKRVAKDSYTISFDWYDVYRRIRVLYVAGAASVNSGAYTDLQVLTKLLRNTITRMDFRRPVEYIYDTSFSSSD